jgi:hypothetical protein
VNIDLRQGQYLVAVYSQTGMGVWVIDGLPTLLPQEIPTEQLGAMIKEMLDKSRFGLPELTRDSQPARPMLDMLGLRDYATYMKGTKSISVYLEDHTIDITPEHNGGSRQGFTPILEAERTLTDDASAELLGAEVIASFDRAT